MDSDILIKQIESFIKLLKQFLQNISFVSNFCCLIKFKNSKLHDNV